MRADQAVRAADEKVKQAGADALAIKRAQEEVALLWQQEAASKVAHLAAEAERAKVKDQADAARRDLAAKARADAETQKITAEAEARADKARREADEATASAEREAKERAAVERDMLARRAHQRALDRERAKLDAGGLFAVFRPLFKIAVALAAALQLIVAVFSMHAITIFRESVEPFMGGEGNGLLAMLLNSGAVWTAMSCALARASWRPAKVHLANPASQSPGDSGKGGGGDTSGGAAPHGVDGGGGSSGGGSSDNGAGGAGAAPDVETGPRPEASDSTPPRPVLPWWPDWALDYGWTAHIALAFLTVIAASPALSSILIPIIVYWDAVLGSRIDGRCPNLLPGMCSLRLAVLSTYVACVLLSFPALVCGASVLGAIDVERSARPTFWFETVDDLGPCSYRSTPEHKAGAALVATSALSMVFTLLMFWGHATAKRRLFDFTNQAHLGVTATGTFLSHLQQGCCGSIDDA
ncbi:hypothetical protein HYH03_001114 [Edaphochlamys debaryana]|uniref:Uncharacterized protein n=1 Tax=Edaphochlamys debaryana TaxID=47281 RepID=A0A835YMQ7_9CHLO|nr:hypothetical protein HYH03_001114 [Edaphochlamys debaryana]|eukprot:KAG2501320.1 hypothetical protein HYH03_001114 [Edaphochlamys debaryana]